MKKILLSLVVVFFSVPAFCNDDVWNLNGFFSVTVQERYFAPNLPENFHDDSMLWSELFLELPHGFYFDVWHSYGLDDSDVSSNFGDEFDLSLGWNHSFDSFNLDAYVSYYNIYKLEQWWSQDLIYFATVFSKEYVVCENHIVSPYVESGWITFLEDFDSGALVFTPGVSHAWMYPCGIYSLVFEENFSVIWNSGIFATEPEDVSLKYDLGFNWQLTESLTLTAPGLEVLLPVNHSNEFRKFDTSLSVTLSYAF